LVRPQLSRESLDLHIDERNPAFDEANLLLYVSLHQSFRIQFLPFHRSEVNLTTVLTLTHDRNETSKHDSAHTPSSSSSSGTTPNSPTITTSDHKPLPLTKHSQQIVSTKKYYILTQNDLYQTSEFVKFVMPWFNIGTLVVMTWQFFSTLVCVVLAILFYPVSWVEENVWGANRKGGLLEIVWGS